MYTKVLYAIDMLISLSKISVSVNYKQFLSFKQKTFAENTPTEICPGRSKLEIWGIAKQLRMCLYVKYIRRFALKTFIASTQSWEQVLLKKWI